MDIQVSKLDPTAILPKFAHQGDVCADLYSMEHTTIPAGQYRIVPTGIALGLLPGWETQVRPRSGLAAKHGITVLNSPGTIDSGYRGEVKVILINHGKSDFTVEVGMRIAQLDIREVTPIQLIEVDDLDETNRGDGGFGSTGM